MTRSPRSLRVLTLTLIMSAMAGVVASPPLSAATSKDGNWKIERQKITYVGPRDQAMLPQEHDWQVTLRNFLKTFKADDFVIDQFDWKYDPAAFEKMSDDQLYRDWILLKAPPRITGTKEMFNTAADLYTLDKIERKDGIFAFMEPAGMAWWTQFDVPNNPFFQNKAAQKRALVSAIVDMSMLETSWLHHGNKRPQFMSANMGMWAYTYLHAGDLMPPDVQKAYKQGMMYYLPIMEEKAPAGVNGNMDMREIATLTEYDEVFGDNPKMHQRFVDEAKKILFGSPSNSPSNPAKSKHMFHPAGYIGEANGPETSYNGIALLHLDEAAMNAHGKPGWKQFMPEVIDRMLKFKAYNTFPEPAGTPGWHGEYNGPSSWAKRTNSPYPYDQRDTLWRAPASAMLSKHGLYLLEVKPDSFDGKARAFATPEVMRKDIKKGYARLNKSVKYEKRKYADADAPRWKQHHWPDDLAFTWDQYLPGSYGRFAKLVKEKSPLLLPPFSREGDFSISFGNDFWMAKQGDWGFQVEAVPDMGWGYHGHSSGALAGGSLATFWTKKTGSVIVGRLPSKFEQVTWSPREHPHKGYGVWSVDTWTTHHLWGRTSQGVAFSSARQREPKVQYNLDADTPNVQVVGEIGSGRTVEPDKKLNLGGNMHYRRKFEMTDAGMRITSELMPPKGVKSAGDQLKELWETLPIFVQPTANKKVDPNFKVEFQVGDHWEQPDEAKLVENVQAVRLHRFKGSVLIEFDHPQRVKLSEPIHTRYQAKDTMHTLSIDLLNNATAGGTKVSYLIKPGQ